jgi:hypothetical protein
VLAGTTIHSGAFFNGISVVSGSAQISFNGITDKPTLVSGSSQITFLSISSIPSGLVSGSSQVLLGSGVWSGSAQLPSGVVSGSSQVLSGTGIWSGSAQLPSGVVSGSSQIAYGSITGVPAGIVSGSSQISFGSISGVPSGLVSGSSQVLNGTTIHSGSFFNGISVVSGSAQISIASTTGFGTYIDQAVLTSSAPTFTALTVSGTNSNTLKVRNTTATSNSNLQMGNDATTNGAGIALLGSSFSASGQYRASGGYIYSNLAGGLTLHAEGANSMYLATNGVAAITINSSQVATFANTISGNINGNAATVTNGVYTSGDQTIGGTKTFSGSITFGSSTRQMITLWGSVYGIGVQSGTQYFRADDNFAWFRDGVHSDTTFDPGSGGVLAMKLDSSSNLTVTGTITSSGSTVKTFANSSYSTTFSSVTSVTVTHNLGTKNVGVFLYDSSDNMFWPSTIVTTSTSVVTITFASSRSGRVVIFA